MYSNCEDSYRPVIIGFVQYQHSLKSDPKSTKINEVDQDSENPVNHNGPKSIKIAPVSQNEPKVTQNLPKLTKLTKIVRT